MRSSIRVLAVEHTDLDWHPLTNGPTVSDILCIEWTMCPTLMEPILFGLGPWGD